MDSKKILSIFFLIVSLFTLLPHGLQARILNSISSPSPSPSPAPGPSNGGCWHHLSKSCRNGSLTACIDSFSTASNEVFLFVKNEGEAPVNVDITNLPAEQITNKSIPVSGHQIKKVNIPQNLGDGNSSILLDAGNLTCVIHMASPAPRGGIFPPAIYMTPINGAYLLAITGLIVGSAWAYSKRGGKGRQGDGVAYQELEMGQPDSPSANNVETADGWEQDWDGDWDELKSKGLTSRPAKRDGQQNNWED